MTIKIIPKHKVLTCDGCGSDHTDFGSDQTDFYQSTTCVITTPNKTYRLDFCPECKISLNAQKNGHNNLIDYSNYPQGSSDNECG